MSTGARWSVAAVTALVGTALLGAGSDARPDARGDRVLVVGDSIMHQSREEVDAALRAAGWSPEIAAIPGTTIDDWVDPLRDLVVEHRPDVAIVELGTNDRGDAPTLPQDVHRLLRVLERVDRVLWLDVQEDAEYPQGAAAINLVLASARVWWDGVELVGFSDHFAGHPEWHALEPPGVHLSLPGQRELARLVTAALGPADEPNRR